ncbi:MAG: Hsp70 family protein [Melioribacteraceae bacterium]|nr:Hsp70 family protein [Melioribacteraceae bacterium]
MIRTKIDYGLDLGTTNSAISRMENGEPVIKKTDTLKDTMPSCVYINKKKAIQVGDSAYNAMKRDKLKAMKNFDSDISNSFIEFKRTMGTDKIYYCSNLDKNSTSEELSAEVIKSLKSFVSDENFNTIVITVPAKFTINQKDATLRSAAEYAGFQHVELLQEPIAASMAYGLESKSKNGYWLVFDFGGGTFDAALLRVEEGIMKVIDTEGDNYLGGKNLDYAIVDEIIIPYLQKNNVIDSILENDVKRKILQDAMKFFAEETKIQMSFNETHNILSDLGDIPGEDDEGEEFELDITVTQDMMKEVIGPIFQKAINICKELLERRGLNNSTLDSLILVGGPTYSPVLRKMLEEQIIKPDTSVDPMTVVSKGAALYASTIDISEDIKEQQRDKTKIQLEFSFEATTVEDEELVTVKILKDKTIGDIPDKIYVDIVRNDKAWSSGKTEIDDIGEIIEVKLNSGKPNAFSVMTFDEKGDLLPSEPVEFTIIQGSKIGSATLPYHIGIDIKDRKSSKIVFKTVPGLEKNQSIPATGGWNGLKTQKQIRPGIKEDFIKIPIYQGEHGADGSRAIYNEHVYDVVISGEDLPKLLPEGSDVDLIIKVDRSEIISFSAFFPTLDHTYDLNVPRQETQKEISADWLESEISKAQHTLNMIKQENIIQNSEEIEKLEEEIDEMKKRFNQGRSDYDRKKDVRDSLIRSLKKIDKMQDEGEWPKIEEELKDVFYRLESVNKELGNEKTSTLVEQFKEQMPVVLKEKNVKVAEDLIENMRALDFDLVDKGLGAQFEIMILKNLHDDFDTLDWKDENRARMILNRGIELAADNPSKQKLRTIVVELYSLLPEAQKPIIGGGDGSHLIG